MKFFALAATALLTIQAVFAATLTWEDIVDVEEQIEKTVDEFDWAAFMSTDNAPRKHKHGRYHNKAHYRHRHPHSHTHSKAAAPKATAKPVGNFAEVVHVTVTVTTTITTGSDGKPAPTQAKPSPVHPRPPVPVPEPEPPAPTEHSSTHADSPAPTTTAKPSPTHTDAPPAPTSSSTSGSSGSGSSSSAFQDSILGPHNALRAKKGAPPLTWNNNIASYAETWAKKCKFVHSGGPNGENLAAGSGAYSNAALIKMWSDEEPSYSSSNPEPSHYTQMVWKGTTQVGCFVQTCDPGTIFDAKFGTSQFMVCEYLAPGNVLGQFPQNVEA